jgi:hypothetical protein
MRYLIAESVALKPHLETAGELALRFRDEGHHVTFSWLGGNLPWSDWHLPKGAWLVGCSLDRRVRRFIRMLVREGVSLLDGPGPDAGRLTQARSWAAGFQGDMAALKDYGFDGGSLGMGAASSLISLHGDSLYDPEANLAEARQCLASAVLVYERACSAILKARPDVVVTFNGRFATSKPIVVAAERCGIPVLRHERGSTFQRYELFTDALHNYAYIRRRIQECWDRTPADERERNGHDFFRRRREGDGIYWYSFTAGQERGRIPERKPDRRRIVYFSSSDDEYAAVTDVFEPGQWPDQLAAVRDLIAVCESRSDVELVLRIHPHLVAKSARERARWSGLGGRNIHIIAPEDRVDSYALLDSADVVVSYGSTIGMEAAYWGRPSILVGPCSYAGSPAVIEPVGCHELALMLSPSEKLHPPARELCLPYGNYHLSYGTPFRYYHPVSLSEGTFLGDRLGWDPEPVHWLRQQGLGKFYRNLLRA